MKAKISKGNTKIGKIPNVSLSPCKACNHDCECKKGKCYALKAYRMYKTAKTAWDHNTKMIKTRKGREQYFISINNFLEKHATKFFRWHVAGDIPNQIYLDCMKAIAVNHPETNFLIFTKMHHLDFGLYPENLTIIFSMWPNWGDNEKPMPRAWLRDKNNHDNRIPNDAIECPGHCDSCGMCWQLPKIGKDVVFDKH